MPNYDVKRKNIPKAVRIKVYDRYKGHCAYCGCEMDYKEMQVDHVKPLYWHGGEDDISNYMPACRACNFYKSTMELEKFREQIQTIPERIEKEFIYRLGKKYGIIEEKTKHIFFYFEKAEKIREAVTKGNGVTTQEEENKTKIEYIGYDTIENAEFFRCENCKDEYILKGFKFCPNCGKEIIEK